MAKAADKKSKEGDVVALQNFTYDGELGEVHRGQVFQLAGHRNDGLLMTYRFVQPMQPDVVLKECGECGALFVEDWQREQHGITAHEMQCDCGWIPDAADEGSMRLQLDQHRTRCAVVREAREQHLMRRAREVREIKKEAEPATVGA